MHGLVNLQQMLVGEGLIDGDIVIAPGIVGGGTWLLTCASAAGDAVDMDISAQDASLECRQQGKLDAGGKSAWIGQMVSLTYCFTMCLWQAIYKIMLSGNTEILSEVYYLNVGGNGMLPEECLALAMAEA